MSKRKYLVAHSLSALVLEPQELKGQFGHLAVAQDGLVAPQLFALANGIPLFAHKQRTFQHI
jgi:hypothetical protein